MVYTLCYHMYTMGKRTERHLIALDQRVYARLENWKNKLFPDQQFEVEGKKFDSRRTSWNEFFIAVMGDLDYGYFTCPEHKSKTKCEYCLADLLAVEQIKNTERTLMAKKLGRSMDHDW